MHFQSKRRIVIRSLKRGLQWGEMGHLEDLDFADDLALISETIKHLQDNTIAM